MSSGLTRLRRGRFEHPFLPATLADVRARGWSELDIIIISGDAYVDHPAFGPPLIARFLEGRGFKVGLIAQPDWRSVDAFRALGRAAPLLRHRRRQHGLDAQSPDRAEEEPRRGSVFARRRARPAARSRHHRLRQPRARGVPRRADRARRHRGVAAPHRPLRLLVGHGAPLDPARCQGGPARLRHGRAAGLGDRAPPARRRDDRRGCATCAAPPCPTSKIGGGGVRRLAVGARRRRARRGHAVVRRGARRQEEVRAGLAHTALRDQPVQRAPAAPARSASISAASTSTRRRCRWRRRTWTSSTTCRSTARRTRCTATRRCRRSRRSRTRS